MSDLRRYDGRTAIITGATSGIGAACARRLHAEGARVLVAGRSQARGQQLVAELGDRALFCVGDLREPETPDKLVRAAVARFGGVDVLVNNAAIDHTGALLEVSRESVEAVFASNLYSALAMLQAAAAVMKTGGAIVNVTSRLANVAVEGMSVYGASKAALAALTRGAAIELAPRGIRVNAVAPGMTRTALFEAWVSEAEDPARRASEVAQAIPLGRVAEPEEVASAVAFLGGRDASHVTGASLAVDGGYTAR